MSAGLTNEYLINTASPAALRYNDQSVNENGHAALGFEVLMRKKNNFLEVNFLPSELSVKIEFGSELCHHLLLADVVSGGAQMHCFGRALLTWKALQV